MLKKVFPILAFAMFSSTLGIGIVSPLLPLYVKDMGATSVWVGIIIAAYGISNSVCVPFVGRLSDKRGRKLFLTAGLLFYAINSLGYVWAGDPAQLTLIRLIQGVAGAMTFPIATAYVGDLSPEGEEGRWQGYANVAFFSGLAFGPLMGGILTEQFGVNVTFFSMGILNLIAFLITLFFLPEVSKRAKGEKFTPPSYREMSRSGMVKGLFSFRLAQAIGRGGIFAFLPIFSAAIGLSTALIGTLISINFAAWIVLAPFGGLIADRMNRRNLTIIGSVLFAVFLALIPLTNNFGQLVVVLLIQGVSSAISMPASTALTVEEGKKYGMGSTMGMFFLAMSLGMAMGPIISGGIADWLGIDSVFYFGTIMGLIGTGLFAWFTKEHRE